MDEPQEMVQDMQPDKPEYHDMGADDYDVMDHDCEHMTQ
jgi:hypothetical protein